jgi:uncharacterized protein (DUF169 family)
MVMVSVQTLKKDRKEVKKKRRKESKVMHCAQIGQSRAGDDVIHLQTQKLKKTN